MAVKGKKEGGSSSSGTGKPSRSSPARRGKPSRKGSRKERPFKNSIDRVDLILEKLDSIEGGQNKILESEASLKREEDKIFRDEELFLNMESRALGEEEKIESEEKRIEAGEKEEMSELRKIEKLEANIKDNLKDSPLKRITYRDVTKGIIGAFIGIIGHFAFVEGVHLSENFSYWRSTMLLAASFVMIVLFLYFSGFRKVDDRFVFQFLPIRAVVIYVSALLTVILVLLLYGMIGAGTTFHAFYNTVAAISILAVLGAGTADLIGKSE
jgi:uncharacterized membrane protein